MPGQGNIFEKGKFFLDRLFFVGKIKNKNSVINNSYIKKLFITLAHCYPPVKYLITWYWIADFCVPHNIPSS